MVAGLNTRDQSTLDLVKKRVDITGLRLERSVQEQVWIKNMAYFHGKDYFYLDEGRIYDASNDIPEHRILYRVNLCRTAAVRAAAKILNVRPQFRAAPASGSIRDRNIAETSEHVFRHIADLNEWEARTLLVGTMWAEVCGSAFYKLAFDPEMGEKDRYYWDNKSAKQVVPERLLTTAETNEKDRDLLFEDIAKGDVRIDVESAFAVFHDWSARSGGVKDCQWIATRKWVDRERVAEMYGIDESDLAAENASQGLTNFEEAIAFMSSNMSSSPYQFWTPEEKRGARCRVVEMFQRPSHPYPKGRWIVYAGGRIIRDKKNPYVGDRSTLAHLPLVKQDWTPCPGRWWGSSLIEDLTSPQHNLNQARSALLEFLRVFGRPQTYIYSDSGLDPKEMTIDPGGVYVIKSTSRPPVHAPVPNIPSPVAEVGNLMQGDFNVIASQSDIEGNKLPAQLRSGEALRQMIEYRDMALSVSANEAVSATRNVGRVGLTLAQMFYTQRRTIAYLNPSSNDFEWIDFSGADLTNNLIVVGQPSIFHTAEGQRAEILDATQAGLFDPVNNPDDKDYLLSSLHYNDSDQGMTAKLQAQKNQEWEIRQMIATPGKWGPQGYPAQPWEDHAREIRTLVNYMYSQEFKRLPRKAQVDILLHYHSHMRFQQQQQMQALQMQMAVAGTPQPKGRVSQPAPR